MKALIGIAISGALMLGIAGRAQAQTCAALRPGFDQSIIDLDVEALALTATEQLEFQLELALLQAECGQFSRGRSRWIDATDTLAQTLNPQPDRAQMAVRAQWAAYYVRWAELQAQRGRFDAARDTLDAALELLGSAGDIEQLRVLEIVVQIEAAAARAGEDNRESFARQDLAGLQNRLREIAVVRRDPAAEAAADHVIVPVFYGTNRSRTGSDDPNTFYGHGRAFLDLGIVRVSVPKNRSVGEIPVPPRRWRGDVEAARSRYFILDGIERFATDYEFSAALGDTVDQSERREVLVYIHGFNTTFRQAAERAAQLSVDLELDGAPTMYSWPSRGSVLSYFADRNQIIDQFARDLRNFLFLIKNDAGADRIHIVAHSMGSEFLLAALEDLAGIYGPHTNYQMFDHIVWASADVEAQRFAATIPGVSHLARDMTVYASSRDRALRISRMIQGGRQRAGDASPPLPVIIGGVPTVVTTRMTTQGVGHDDFSGPALNDFRAIVWLSLSPEERCILVTRRNDAGVFYEIAPREYGAATALSPPDGDRDGACSSEVFETAITAVRREGVEEARGRFSADIARDSGGTIVGQWIRSWFGQGDN